ncbi:MAG: carbohydrate ABC transporter permease [Clostridia bacterium]|nr:carbohydrate ABC transporter permease [Clostridia bacterium]
MWKKSKSRRIFEVFNVLFMFFMMFIMLYPLIFVLNASFSDSNALIRNGGAPLWLPLEPTANAYVMTFKNPLIVSGYLNTIFIVIAGTLVSVIMSAMCAYPLSKRGLMLNGIITKLIMFTMMFGGGLIPFYLLVKNLGLTDNLWGLIIPTAISTYNMIVLRTGFAAVPESLSESALIDGAGHMTILFKIMIPLAKASFAVIALYYGVAYWNSWFHASIFLQRDSKQWPLQLVLRQILIMNDVQTGETAIDQQQNIAESIKYAVIVVATVPILCVYPFIQKYFTKGVMVGAVKG